VCPTLLLPIDCPSQFIFNPNQTHLKQPIKVFRITWKLKAECLIRFGDELCRTVDRQEQGKPFLLMLILLMHQIGICVAVNWGTESSQISSKISSFVFQRWTRVLEGFGTTWGWVIYERIFILGWTSPLDGSVRCFNRTIKFHEL